MPLAAQLFAADFDAATFHFTLHAFGFADAPRAEKLLRSLAPAPADREALAPIFDALLENLSRSADPERALLNLSNLCDRVPNRAAFFARLGAHPTAGARLMELLSWSQALADAVIGDAANLDETFRGGRAVSRGALRELADDCADLNVLRRFRKSHFLRIGLLDLERQTWRNEAEFNLIVRQISDLAQVVIERALALVSGGDCAGFCVMLMGKGGARELNYSSDVDLIFLSENRDDAALVGEKLLRALNEITAAGQLWRADMRLRPEGTKGPLVAPIGYALSYYESYAAAWEWQALIKTRAVAGDARLARRFRKFTRSITWARRADDAHLREVWEMKRRAEKTSDGSDERNLKSGPGGIRDAEWIVQQLQMMVGPTHPRARVGDTLSAIQVLDDMEILAPDEARQLRDGYLWLRVAEHRLQLWNEQAVRRLPDKPDDRAALARRLGCSWRGAAAARWLDEENAHVRGEVRALCERLFWAFSVDDGQWESRLPPLAVADEQGRKRIERLASGTSNQPLPAPLSRQIRAALPGALRGLDRAANPERALVAFENLCEASGNRLSLLRALDGAPRLCDAIWTILGGSQFLAETLVRFPELLDLTANRELLKTPSSRDDARAHCRSYCLAFRDRAAALRRWRAREFLRIGLRDLVLDVSPLEITDEITFLAGACLDLATEEVGRALQPDSYQIEFGILGLGKLGGVEMHYASDCDAMFVYQAPDGTSEGGAIARKWAEDVMKFMGQRTADGVGWEVDARLRPHGSSGPLASSPEALREYFENPQRSGFATWERQALVRARIVAGDVRVGARAMALIRNVAFPREWQPSWSNELRHMKSRIEHELGGDFAPASARGSGVFDVKLGRGALRDIEWSAQWLAVKWGFRHPSLQTPGTLRQLEAAREAELISGGEFEQLELAYLWLRRAELRLQIAREGGASAIKRDSPDAAIWARATFPGVPIDEAKARFEQAWERHTSNVRRVFERVRDEL